MKFLSGSSVVLFSSLVLLASGVTPRAQREARAPQREARAHTSDSLEIRVPGSNARARVWTETDAEGREVPFYSLSLDGQTFGAAKATNYDLLLRFQRFDPLRATADVPAALRAAGQNRLFIVQYWTQGIEPYRKVLRSLGVEIHLFLANHANVVELEPSRVQALRALPFVRSVTPYHPGYKLEDELRAAIELGNLDAVTVNLLTMRRGGQGPVGTWIEQHGGTVEHVSKETHLMTATLSYAELPGLAARDDVQWIDRWGPPGTDMNRARSMHGANYVETELGVTGQGVRIEVMDTGFDTLHPDMQNFLVHNGNTVGEHGTCTSGIVVGTGLGFSDARGAAPDALLVVSDFDLAFAGGSRYAHTAELVNPALSYQCVLQSNSWGGSWTTDYSALSADMDLILFDHDRISICQSQSNTGSQLSRPQAWAKNIIAVGGIMHHDTLTKADDDWSFGASIGPAADGRVKPDLASYYDAIYCTDRVGALGYSGTDYFASFGGTSGATPIVAGHLGLIYQMWHQGVFGNDTPGATVFENAPYNTTAKALLINSASPWSFSGLAHDLTRTHQGWGHPRLQSLLDGSDRMVVVDESDVLTELDSTDYVVQVLSGEPALRVTLVYRDPPGTTSALLHRINDLDLTVTSPSSVVYHGNVGLLEGTVSTPGGSPNGVDTVENVFLNLPESGTWTVTVTATEVNQDSHTETGEVDVDYALVVTGAEPAPTNPPAAPSDLAAEASAHQVRLEFVDNSGDEDGFELERSLDGFSFLPLVTLGMDETTHVDIPVAANTTYHYRVRGFNVAGASSWSNVAVVRTLKTLQHPGPP